MTQPNWEKDLEPECIEEIKSFIQKSIQQAREEVVRDLIKYAENTNDDDFIDIISETMEDFCKVKGISLTPNTEIQ